MQDKILSEIKQIRIVLSELVGTSDSPVKQKFSKEALANAAKEFRNLSCPTWQLDFFWSDKQSDKTCTMVFW